MDHLERYKFALEVITSSDSVLDCACGSGYGTKILSRKAKTIVGYDIDEPTIKHARKNMPELRFECGDLQNVELPETDVLVSFETIEHLEKPEDFLKNVNTKMLIGSVPNEDNNPFNPYKFIWHKRHYTLKQIFELLGSCGFSCTKIGYQIGKESPVVLDDNLFAQNSAPGMTIVFVAIKNEHAGTDPQEN